MTEDVFSDLEQFGQRLCDEIDILGRQAELELPYLRLINTIEPVYYSETVLIIIANIIGAGRLMPGAIELMTL